MDTSSQEKFCSADDNRDTSCHDSEHERSDGRKEFGANGTYSDRRDYLKYILQSFNDMDYECEWNSKINIRIVGAESSDKIQV